MIRYYLCDLRTSCNVEIKIFGYLKIIIHYLDFRHLVSLEASDQVFASGEATPSRKVCLDNVIIACHATRTEHPPESLFNAVAIELQAGTHP